MSSHHKATRTLDVQIESRDETMPKTIPIEQLVIAGWTGRDRHAMDEHIKELKALGVAPPKKIPTYYRIASSRLSTAPLIEVSGSDSSGEVEFVLVVFGGNIYVGLGSDHTDREVETYGVTISKQVCDKPISNTFWPLKEIVNHWDELILRSYVSIDGNRKLYQEGSVAALLSPRDLTHGYCQSEQLPDGTVIFGGTLPAIGGIRPAVRFEGELEDPVLNRKIALKYDLLTLPIEG